MKESKQIDLAGKLRPIPLKCLLNYYPSNGWAKEDEFGIIKLNNKKDAATKKFYGIRRIPNGTAN